jgi:shikimate 5-dehydrogenase
MKLALLGHGIAHSLSPSIYRKLLGPGLESYKLIDRGLDEAPRLDELSRTYDGLNITTPFKQRYLEEVKVVDPFIRKLGCLNTLAFTENDILGTNTDFPAVLEILTTYKRNYPHLSITLLGSGVMAQLTLEAARLLDLPIEQYSRKSGANLAQLDLTGHYQEGVQSLIINACSRSFVFSGELHSDFIFWDYNYSYPPHAHLASQVKHYQDGQEMLFLQAKAAVKFWYQTNPKLKC